MIIDILWSFFWKQPRFDVLLNEWHQEWWEIKENWHINGSVEFVHNSFNFAQETSIFPHFSTLVCDKKFGLVFKNSLIHFIILDCACVKLWDLNNDFKSDKMNDASFDGVLICKHIDIDYFWDQTDAVRDVGKTECNVRTCKLLWMVVDIFHKLTCFLDVWELHQMECLGANELSKQQLEEPICIDFVSILMIVT